LSNSIMLPSPEDYPEFDPILLKCIGYLGMGGKEARRGLKELYTELVSAEHRASPLHHQKSDKRKGALLEKDPSKKARLEPDDIVFETSKTDQDGANPVESSGLNEKCANCTLSVTTVKNQLIDCNECHNWFHQNCQTPPVPAKVLNDRASDTRFVWKCHDCSTIILKMKEPKKKENASKVGKETNAQPFNRANSKITNIVKERSRSRESSPSTLGGGWAALGAKADKPKKEKKLQQFDMFGDVAPPELPAQLGKKKKGEVNPSAIKALKEKERKKREGSQTGDSSEKTKKTKSRDQKEDDAAKKIQSMKKKGAEKMKLKAAAKRV